jgi:hypothetical protein
MEFAQNSVEWWALLLAVLKFVLFMVIYETEWMF